MMTRQDYIKIADVMIAARHELATANMEAPDPDTQYALDTVIDLLADALREDNERFDRARFLKACGYMLRLADVR